MTINKLKNKATGYARHPVAFKYSLIDFIK